MVRFWVTIRVRSWFKVRIKVRIRVRVWVRIYNTRSLKIETTLTCNYFNPSSLFCNSIIFIILTLYHYPSRSAWLLAASENLYI